MKLPPVTPARKGAAWAAAAVLAAAPIAEHEGLRQSPYKDVVGVWTQCYGETHGITADSPWQTKAQCQTRLAKSIKKHADEMQVCVKVDVPIQSLGYGIIPFGYNIGAPKFCSSTLVKKLNTGDLKAACDEMPKWVYAGGIKWNGLINRRASERAGCLSGLEPGPSGRTLQP